jgi:hypothetical protein
MFSNTRPADKAALQGGAGLAKPKVELVRRPEPATAASGNGDDVVLL